MGRGKSRQPGRSGRLKGMGRSIRREGVPDDERPRRSGEPPPQIHLRRLTAEEALAKLEQRLALHRRRGERRVLVVHGRGLRSAGAPVIAPLVREWLRDHPELVAAWEPAPPDWGGEGALVVTLTRIAPAGEGGGSGKADP